MSNKIYNKSANGHDFDRKRF
jgi:hypothetical protein